MLALYPLSSTSLPRRSLLPLLLIALLGMAFPGMSLAVSIPTISSVTGPSGGTYLTGQTLSFTVTYNTAVTVIGTPQLPITIGTTARNANFATGSGSTALVFSYTIQGSDLDVDGIASASPLSLNGGTIKDSVPTNASLTFTPPTTTSVLVGLQRQKNGVISGFPVYVRPGQTSYTWRIVNGDFGGNRVMSPIIDFAFHNVGPPINFTLTRGQFQYSANGGTNWTAVDPVNLSYIPVAGKVWRFVDALPGNTTYANPVGMHWHNTANPGTATGNFENVVPDNAPTDITSSKSTVFSTAVSDDTVATLTPVDTGDPNGGSWVIDSQSVSNLFTLTFDNTVDNKAVLKLSAGTMPAIGQIPTVTVRYYDVYQTDNSGVPIPGQGFAKTLSYTVVSETSNDLTLGNDLPVNTFTANNQSAPATATLTTGNVAVVWQSAGQGGKSPVTNSGIYGQLISSTGTSVGSEFMVSNAGAAVDEVMPVVSALNAGRFVVAYSKKSGTEYDIAFRIIEANGTAGSQIIANTTTALDQQYPSVATLTDGSFVVAWCSGNGDIRARQFAAAGGSAVGAEVLFADGATAGGFFSGIASLSDGSYVVGWVDGNSDVIVKVAGGSAVNTGIVSGYYGPPRIAGLSGGGFVVTCDVYNTVTNLTQIEAVRYNNSGTIQGTKFLVNTLSGGNRYGAAVAALSGGGFVIGWNADSHSDYDLNGVFGRRYTSAGADVDTTEFEINQHRAGDQAFVALAPLASDAFAAAWTFTTAASIAANTNLGDIHARVLLTSAPAPTITGVTSTTADGRYKAGTVIPINVNFTTSVTATGNPTLALNTGGTATYASGSPGLTLTFNYTVGASQNTTDLDYSLTTSLTLAGGTINATSGGTPATLTLPAPGAANSLGANKAIVIDTTAPTILSINRLTPSGQTTGSSTVTFRVTYSEAVTGMTNSSFSVVAVNSSNIVGTVTGVSNITSTTCDVSVSITSGTGEFRLRGVN